MNREYIALLNDGRECRVVAGSSTDAIALFKGKFADDLLTVCYAGDKDEVPTVGNVMAKVNRAQMDNKEAGYGFSSD